MEQIVLDAELRNITGRAVKHLRREGYVPAVVYGHRTDPVSLQVSERALHQALRVAGTNRLITLNVPGQESPKMVLVRELQRDALSHAMLHVDFYEVVMTEKITAEVPIVLIGESKLVKSGGGLLFQGLDAIEVECLPGDLPQQVEIDLVGLLEIDQTIMVRELKLGDAVQVLTDLNEVVVKILPPEAEEVEEAPAPTEAAEVEVVGKKVKAEEEAVEQEAEPAGKEKQQPAGKEKQAPAAKEKQAPAAKEK
jgi:large subunit ribosomal protein L25